jgi:hypothetical protein
MQALVSFQGHMRIFFENSIFLFSGTKNSKMIQLYGIAGTKTPKNSYSIQLIKLTSACKKLT